MANTTDRTASERDGLLSGLNPIQPTHQDTVAVEVARQLVEALLASGSLPAGERLPSERQLAATLGVGRSTVREALKTLHFLGIIDVRPGAGTFLVSPEAQFLPKVIEWGLLLGERRVWDLIEARALLEAETAGLAASRRDEAALDELAVLVDSMRGASIDEFIEADIAFHLKLASCTGNRVLPEILSNIQSLLRVWMRRVLDSHGVGDVVDQHQKVLDAVRDGDPTAARAAMEDHMRSARHRLGEAFSGDEKAR